jgi:hypothetical protein
MSVPWTVLLARTNIIHMPWGTRMVAIEHTRTTEVVESMGNSSGCD